MLATLRAIQILVLNISCLAAAFPKLAMRSPPNAFDFILNCTGNDFDTLDNGLETCQKVINSFTTAGQILSNVFDISTPLTVMISANKNLVPLGALAVNTVRTPVRVKNGDGRLRYYPIALAKQVLSDPNALENEGADLYISVNVVDHKFYSGDNDHKNAVNSTDLRWVALHEMTHGLGLGSGFRRSRNSNDIYTHYSLFGQPADKLKLDNSMEMAFDQFIIAKSPFNASQVLYRLSNKYNEVLDLAGNNSFSKNDYIIDLIQQEDLGLHKEDDPSYSLLRYVLRQNSAAQQLADTYLRNITDSHIFAFLTKYGTLAHLAAESAHFNDNHGLDHFHISYGSTSDFLMQPFSFIGHLEAKIAVTNNLTFQWNEGEALPTNIDLNLALGPLTRQVMATLGWKLRGEM